MPYWQPGWRQFSTNCQITPILKRSFDLLVATGALVALFLLLLLTGLLVMAFLGRLVKEKGLLELFHAAQMVRERLPCAQFLVIGPEDHSKPDALTPTVAQEYGVADCFRFLGLRNDMPELYALMDMLAHPSHREGFPRAPMEAAAMGIPCVATDIRGCREVVIHNETGILVPKGDTESLASAIIDLASNRERARHMGSEGRRIAQEQFDEQIVFAQVRREYGQLLAQRYTPTVAARFSQGVYE